MTRKPGIVRECEHPGKPHKHGMDCYNRDGCRCEAGRAALREYQASRVRAKAYGRFQPAETDATGARRRIQALMTLGYGSGEIAEGSGTSRNTITRINIGLHQAVRVTLLSRISAFYDTHWDKPSEALYSQRVRNHAAKRGFPPPLSWDDDSIDDPLAEPFEEASVDVDWLMVDRAVNGTPRGRRLTAAERQAAMLVMAQQGHTATGISNRLGVSGTDARRAVEAAA